MVSDSKFRMRSPDRENQVGQARVAVIGSKGVGKTALTVRYLTKRFIGEYQSDTDLVYKVTMPVDGNKLSLEILDLSTNSLSEENIVSRETLDWAEAWLVVYSITSRESYDTAIKALEEVTNSCLSTTPESTTPAALPALVMANKRDLEHIRKVSEDEGKFLATKYGCRFVEVSAAEMDSQINDSLDELLRHLAQVKGQNSPRLRKISVSKMLNNLINRSTSVNATNGGSVTDRPLLQRVSFRERTRKKNNLKLG